MTDSGHEPLDPALFRELVRRSLAEDLGWGDVTTDVTVPGDARARATLVAVEPCVVAGLGVADEAFHQLDPAVRLDVTHRDGDACAAGAAIASWDGRAAALLTAQRTALNFLERLSGIATATRRVVEATKGRTRVVTTRSTTPTLRAIEHYAVEVGGGTRHRAALDGGVVIRRPHVHLAGGLREALSRTAHLAHELPIEVEVQTPEDVEVAVAGGATRLLVAHAQLDAVEAVLRAARGRLPVHASGDFSPDEAGAVSAWGADMISVIGITRRAPWASLRFDLEPL